MRQYYANVENKLKEIFSEHCDLGDLQYDELFGMFLYLEADIQEEEPIKEIEQRQMRILAVVDFLEKTEAITMKEYGALIEFAGEMLEAAYKLEDDRA